MNKAKYSVVIPVYNSEGIVATTLDRTAAFFEQAGLDYEIVAVNDNSRDGSWEVIAAKARENPRIVAINLLRNYGQHNANMCGFMHATGDWVVTMDDDLQNPPEEIAHLIEKAAEGHDLVIGRFREKKHVFYRRIGSKLIGAINHRIFYKDKDLVLTNFRLIRRDVIDRITGYRTSYPYVPGLSLMFSNSRANTWVEHHPRTVGQTNYSLYKILKLVATILFNYSSYPLRVVAAGGLVVSLLSFLLGGVYLGMALFRETQVPGWTTLVVLLSFFNGITMMILGMLGEYVVRLLNQSSSSESFHVKEVVRVPAEGA
ncbi:MAG: glycosyltransferase family 2 protein [Nitrospirota bacterium]|nr:glycosyltransferase family 2 protein [Nitrospirota bacterium]